MLFSRHIPTLLKVDVEGYEYQVLRGAKNILGDPDLKAVIIEINSLGKKYFGFDDSETHATLRQFHFQPCRYDPWTRQLLPTDYYNTEKFNTIYLRDLEFVGNRVQKGPKFTVLNQTI